MSNITKYTGMEKSIWDLVDESFDAFWREPGFQLSRNWRPTDVTENDKEFVIEVELPRFKKNQINVSVDKGSLIINAKNDKTQYTRSFSLSNADVDKADVTLDSGVLSVKIPKLKTSSVKTLEIKEVKS